MKTITNKSDKKKEIISWIITIIISISIAIGIQVFFQINKVSGNSMEPNLHDGDVFISLRANWTNIERGDIVDIDSRSLRYVGGDMLVKRIIGLPGEKVKFENGIVYINNKKINKNFKIIDEKKDRNENLDVEIKLKDDEYFVLGDNRNHSTDSRIVGAVTKEKITSKYLFVLPDVLALPFYFK